MSTAAPGQATPAPEALAAVEADFPGWHAWGSNTGRWWATRTGQGARWDACEQVPMTVDAGDEAGLRAELAGLAETAALSLS